MCEYVRVLVCVRVRWCMSASVRSHVWAMVCVCVCIFVCLRVRLYAFCQGQTHSTHIFVCTCRSRNSAPFLLYQIWKELAAETIDHSKSAHQNGGRLDRS